MRWTAAQLPDLRATTAIVTGGNSGIGWQVARELVAHGAHVVLACRDPERGECAARRMRASDPHAEVEVRQLDLASMRSVRTFGEAWDRPLDLLVNNAGVMAPPRRARTEDGFELQFGTNHIGHFVLTGLLLPALLASAGPRVVTVSSIAHHGGAADVVEGNAGPSYDAQRSYSNSKLANLLFADELHRQATARGSALVSTAAHPGVAATGLVSDPEGMGANALVRAVVPVLLHLFTQTAGSGARATLYAATEAEPGSYTGPRRLGETRGAIGPARRSPLAADVKLARRLWHASEELTGFQYVWATRR